jgi:DNA modification methylase
VPRKFERRDVAPDTLYPSEDNPRRITADRFEALRHSIRENPEHLQARPIVTTWEGRIVAGEMRWRAAMAEGAKTVPNFRIELTDDEARLWLLRDNNEYGEWVEDELAKVLYELEQAGADMTQTGFEENEVSNLIDLVAGPEKHHRFPDDPAPNPPAKPKSKVGQVYKLGPHRLMCGDATNPKHVARLLGDAKPRLIATDPPYGVELDLAWRSEGERDDEHKTTKIAGDTRVDWSEAFELVPSADVLYVWHASTFGPEVGTGLQRIGFVIAQQIVWDKMAFALSRSRYHWRHEAAYYAARVGAEVPWYGPAHDSAWYARRKGAKEPWLGSRDQVTIWSAPSPKRAGGDEDPVDHPTQKPTLLWTTPIRNHLRRGDALYEPFAGSGTAVIAAEMTGRVCYAMEFDPAFVDVIRERYAEFTA